jgi:hypothetical protein
LVTATLKLMSWRISDVQRNTFDEGLIENEAAVGTIGGDFGRSVGDGDGFRYRGGLELDRENLRFVNLQNQTGEAVGAESCGGHFDFIVAGSYGREQKSSGFARGGAEGDLRLDVD